MYMGNSLSGPDMLLKFQTLRDKLGPDIKFYVSPVCLLTTKCYGHCTALMRGYKLQTVQVYCELC
jgi:hypothetical protein